jgi:hypothetical protein
MTTGDCPNIDTECGFFASATKLPQRVINGSALEQAENHEALAYL